jgi:hypothetical protein
MSFDPHHPHKILSFPPFLLLIPVPENLAFAPSPPSSSSSSTATKAF